MAAEQKTILWAIGVAAVAVPVAFALALARMAARSADIPPLKLQRPNGPPVLPFHRHRPAVRENGSR